MYWDVIEESWDRLKEQVRKQWDGLDSKVDDATDNRDPTPVESTESAALPPSFRPSPSRRVLGA